MQPIIKFRRRTARCARRSLLRDRWRAICQVATAVWLSAGLAVADPPSLTGMTHRYSLDDGSGTIALDSVGGNDANLTAFPAGDSHWITGIFGGALNFNHPNAYAITSSPIPSDVFSVSFWMRSNVKPNNNARAVLTPQGDNWITYSSGLGVGIGTVHDPKQPLKLVWEHYVVTVDRTAGAAAVYRDGALRAAGAVSLPALDSLWVFGHNQDPGNTNGSFDGALDEVQFYDRVLAPLEAASLATRPVQPGLAAHLVAPAQNFGFQPVGEYATATISIFIDPEQTDWVAWNRFPQLRAVSDDRPGEFFLGTYTPEVDDSFNLKITNPLDQVMVVPMDRNGSLGEPIGRQSVIFGSAADAPDVVRGDNFGTASFFNENGVFNSVFTSAGIYTFDFSFQNIGGEAGYPDIYLLVQAVPEPETMSLAIAGLGCLTFAAVRLKTRRTHAERAIM